MWTVTELTWVTQIIPGETWFKLVSELSRVQLRYWRAPVCLSREYQVLAYLPEYTLLVAWIENW